MIKETRVINVEEINRSPILRNKKIINISKDTSGDFYRVFYVEEIRIKRADEVLKEAFNKNVECLTNVLKDGKNTRCKRDFEQRMDEIILIYGAIFEYSYHESKAKLSKGIRCLNLE